MEMSIPTTVYFVVGIQLVRAIIYHSIYCHEANRLLDAPTTRWMSLRKELIMDRA